MPDDPRQRGQCAPALRFHHRMQPSVLETRGALDALDLFLNAAGLTAEARSLTGLAIAEALNNVVEHAAPAAPDSPVLLDGVLDDTGLAIEIVDRGAAMPGLTLPAGDPPRLDCAFADLPEGGFGWLLIRSLTDRLSYSRAAGTNRLALFMSCSRLG